MTDSHNAEAPWQYTNRGIPVFPLNGKKPYEQGGFHTATVDPDQINQWIAAYPGCNWGMPTGAASGWDVLDIDGPIGMKSLQEFEAAFSPLPETPLQETGSGGLHFLFKTNGMIRNSAKGMAPGWDTRGDGGYIVVSPSIHPETGQPYRWLREPWECDAALWPEQLIALYTSMKREKRSGDEKIVLGTQETEMTRLTGSLLRQGFSKDEAFTAMLKVAVERCDPPVAEQDVRRIVESIYSRDPEDPLLTKEWTDRGWGLRFRLFAGDRVKYVTNAKRWATWSGKSWEMNGDLDAWLVLDELIDTMIIKTEQMPDTTDDEKSIKETAVAWAKSGRKSRTQDVALNQGKRFMQIDAAEFDAQPWLFACENGVIDLKTGTLHDHQPGHLLTRASGVKYNPDAKSELWDWFLDQTTMGDKELQEYIQRVVGYTMTGEISEQLLMVVYGPTGSGKSTFINAVEAMFGTYSQKLSNGTLILKRDPDSAAPGIAKLAGARLVSGVEIDKGRRLDESLIKSLTGNEQISTRALYQEEFTFTPQFTMWLATNDAPLISASDSVFRRIKRVPFDHSVPADQRRKNVNEDLRLLSEHQEAILTWAVQGCLVWQKDGIGTAKLVEESTADYKEDMSPVLDFIEACCSKPTDGWVSRDQLFMMYQTYRKTRGLDPPGHNRHFFGDMRDAGFREMRRTIGDRQVRGFAGIELKEAFRGGGDSAFEKMTAWG